MARYVTTVRTQLSPEEAFEYMADLRNFAESVPGVKKVVQVVGTGGGLDTEFDVSVSGTTMRYRTTVFNTTTELVAVAKTRVLTSTDRVTIVRHGRSVRTGTLAALREHVATSVEAVTAQPLPGVRDWAGVSDVQEHAELAGTHVLLRVSPDYLPEVVTAIAAGRPSALVVHPPDLESLFLEHYRDDPQDGVLPAVAGRG